MADELILQIKATFAEIPSASETISTWLTKRNAPADVQYFANLAIEEFVTNCIKYGYQDDREHVIEIRLQLSESELTLTVVDDGRPFNPLDAPAPDTTATLECRQPGGLGIALVRAMMDEVRYERRDGHNVLTLVARLPAPTTGKHDED